MNLKTGFWNHFKAIEKGCEVDTKHTPLINFNYCGITSTVGESFLRTISVK